MVILRSAAMLIIHAIKTRPDFATSSVSKISIFARPHARFQITCGFKNFHSGERFQKVADSHANSLDTCGRKANPERKSCEFKNIWIPCKRGLRLPQTQSSGRQADRQKDKHTVMKYCFAW